MEKNPFDFIEKQTAFRNNGGIEKGTIVHGQNQLDGRSVPAEWDLGLLRAV